MTDDLFPDCYQDSPRLAWMKKLGLFCNRCERGVFLAIAKDAIPTEQTLFYETEDDALSDFAVRYGIPLWNELNNSTRNPNDLQTS